MGVPTEGVEEAVDENEKKAGDEAPEDADTEAYDEVPEYSSRARRQDAAGRRACVPCAAFRLCRRRADGTP